eukprot:Tbor_TRINITY_DN5431_c1_g1::TRINITY_DN5431_c1_g1_i3::g.24766::m.24766/K01697/CBS; cystathionine beta-synthase
MDSSKITQSFLDRRTQILDSCLDAIGQTPCIRLQRVPKEWGLRCEVIAKCECYNPGGSLKDRIAKEMIYQAEQDGRIKEGQTMVEATSGNTGIGLSMAAAAKGYNMVIVMPTKMSRAKEVTINTLGAEVIRTPMVPSEHPDSLISVAKTLTEEKGYVCLDQYSNPGNPDAHYKYTAQEIYEQCGGKIDMIVIGAGTGGTVTGIGKRLKELLPNIIVVGVDPHGSILANPDEPIEDISYEVEGIGYDFIPKVCERQYVDKWVKSSDKESFELALAVHKKEGILCGGSSGSVLWGAVEAAKDLTEDQRCVVVFPDNIRNYVAKFADRNWMIEKGFLEGDVTVPTYETLLKEKRDLESRVAQLEAKLVAKSISDRV